MHASVSGFPRKVVMDFTETVVGTLLSTSVVLVIAGFIARESFARLLDSRLERFRHGLEVDLTKRQLTIQSQIERKERQLSEFYGPIYAMLKRGRTLVRLLLDGKLDPIREQFWVLAYKTNSEIETILLTRSHLIEGQVMPLSFIQFLTHVPLWRAWGEATGGTPPPKEEIPEAWYSTTFEADVYETTERLKRELDDLYARYGLERAG
jgi:hypothetical protein